ncbi:hypothetical protein ACT18_00370 [Mycolicibacter kumamotonensis]|uniref:DUF488 domain-containing protein n=1 Tax=Mycolicibacter kumamotonensis TaxID=354243 RepID=A0A1B8SM48_9MYCO|nr:hypothetical protein ACT18_00370 [Mycolicibacter kumamotonensis]
MGHGYETWVKFNERLKRHDIAELADVRSFPGSRRSPQFNQERMPDWLRLAGVTYSHWPNLGGRRKPPKERIPEDQWWQVESFANYAAYTHTQDFALDYEALLEQSKHHNVAIMCGEPAPFRCHRRMISDLATRDGVPVYHIWPNGSAKLHELSGWLKQEGCCVG